MSLSNKLAIGDVDVKDKRVLIRVSQTHSRFSHELLSSQLPGSMLTVPVTGRFQRPP
jgi:hypothetical protein